MKTGMNFLWAVQPRHVRHTTNDMRHLDAVAMQAHASPPQLASVEIHVSAGFF